MRTLRLFILASVIQLLNYTLNAAILYPPRQGGGQFVTPGTGITLITNGNVVTIIATGTNSTTVTNVILRAGNGGVIILTNAPTDWSLSGYWVTNIADGSITNINRTLSGYASVGGSSATLLLDTLATGSPLIVGNTNLFRVGGSGNLDLIKGVQYTWPAAHATLSGMVLSSTTGGTLSWVTNGIVVSAGSNITLATNGNNVTISSTGGGGGGSDLWTNDVDGPYPILRPVDQYTRMVEIFQHTGNPNSLFVLFENTNGTPLFTAGVYGENLTTNSGTKLLYDSQGVIGTLGEVIGAGSTVLVGEGAGLYGLADSPFSLQYGSAAMALAQVDGQTNVGVAGVALDNGKAGTVRVGVYAETAGATLGSVVNPNHTGSVFLGDSKDSNLPLLTLSTNNGTVKWQVTAGGNLKQVNGAGAGLIMVSDANGVGSWGANASTVVTTNLTVLNFASISNLYATNVVFNGTIITNIVQGIGPGTTQHIAMFINTTNVGDSIMNQVATNMVDWRSRPSGTVWTNGITNRIFFEYTSEANSAWLDVISPPSQNGYAEVVVGQGASRTTIGLNPIKIGSLVIEPTANPISGHTAYNAYPFVNDNGLFGTTSIHYHGFTAGSAGYLMTGQAASTSTLNFGHVSGYGFALSQADMGLIDNGGNIFGRFYNTGAGQQGLDIGVRQLMGGDTDSAYGSRMSFLMFHDSNVVQVGTNNVNGSAVDLGKFQGMRSSGADKPAGDVALQGGDSTGTGRGGAVRLRTLEPAAATSSTRNSGYYDRYWAESKSTTLTTNSATGICTITLPTSLTTFGCKVFASTHVDNGTDMTDVTEEVFINAANKAGTVTTHVSSPADTTTISTGSSGCTTAWTATVSSTTVTIKVNATTTGINHTVATCRWQIQLNSGSASVLTAL